MAETRLVYRNPNTGRFTKAENIFAVRYEVKKRTIREKRRYNKKRRSYEISPGNFDTGPTPPKGKGGVYHVEATSSYNNSLTRNLLVYRVSMRVTASSRAEAEQKARPELMRYFRNLRNTEGIDIRTAPDIDSASVAAVRLSKGELKKDAEPRGYFHRGDKRTMQTSEYALSGDSWRLVSKSRRHRQWKSTA